MGCENIRLMKLQYKPLDKGLLSSIYAQRMYQPYVGGNWHYHKEFELIYYLKGQGMRIVGDHISHFQVGEIVLVGQWLPHVWRNDIGITNQANADFVVIKFTKDHDGIPLFSLPDLSGIKNLLNKSYRGISFSKSAVPKIHDIILELCESHSANRLINLLRILQILAEEESYQFLSSSNFSLPMELSGENKLQRVINYISENYSNTISLKEIAGIACMTPPAFCRFFKSKTNKTFSVFLNEVRISNSCRQLINGENSIKQICYDVGFGSLTNFNRTFRSFQDVSPSTYRKRFNIINK